MPLMLLCTAGVGIAIVATLKKLRRRQSPFAVDMGKYICILRYDVLPESIEQFNDQLLKYLSQGISEDERDLARDINALSNKRIGDLFVELMHLDYAD